MNDRIKIIFLIGLPGSGKSTYCQNYLVSKSHLILSSDEIRESKYLGMKYTDDIQADTKKTLELKIIESIKEKEYKYIVLDTTYYNSKEKRHDLIQKINAEVEDIEYTFNVFNIGVKDCIKRDSLRDKNRKVGEEIILKLYHQLDVPVSKEIENYKIDFKINNIIEDKSLYKNIRVNEQMLTRNQKNTINYIVKEAEKIEEKYLNKEITGESFSFLVDDQLTFEDFYIEDLKSNNSFPVMYYNGIFLSVDYSILKLTDSLKTTIIRVEKVSVIGNFREENYNF